MRVGYDAKRFLFNKTGLGNYSRTLIEHVSKLITVILYSPEKSKKTIDHQLITPSITPILWRFWRVIFRFKQDGLNLYHGLSGELPLGIHWLKQTKSIVTIHDVIFKLYPSHYSFIDRLIYRFKTWYAIHFSEHIIAISQSTQKDIEKYYKIDARKISVLYQAAQSIFYENTPKKKTQKNPYYLFVSSISPRKNLMLLIEAYNLLDEKQRKKVIVVGSGKAHLRACQKQIKDYGLNAYFEFKEVHAIKDLKAFYLGAEIFIYPSIYEGFGIPILEAMLCKTPVITSNCSSMPEVAEDHAFYIDPLDAQSLKTQIQYIENNPDMVKEKVLKAYELAHQKYNPEKLAGQLVNLYDQILK